jgi:hypothetical protein
METDCRSLEHWQGCLVYSGGAKFVKEKLCARFVPQVLMKEQKQEWIASFQNLSFPEDEY